MPYTTYGSFLGVIKTTVYLPEKLHQALKVAASERGTSEAELLRTAVRNELLGEPSGRAEQVARRARMLAAMGKLDSETYPPEYLASLRGEWRD